MKGIALGPLLLGLLLSVLAACTAAPGFEAPPPKPVENPGPSVNVPEGLQFWIDRAGEKDYPLYAGDTVQISVQGHPKYTIERKIPADGKIPLHLVTEPDADGTPRHVEILFAGKKVPELEEELKGYYSRLVSPPYVTVRVISYRPKKIYIAGAVASPRDYVLPDDQRISLVQALTMAGWFTPSAAADRVRIMRVDPATGRRIFLPPIDVRRIVTEGLVELDLPLEPGDTITVDSKESQQVFIFGEVQRPGEYVWVRGITLSRLITKAGGLGAFPKTSDIRILRPSSSGPDRVFRVDLEAIYDEEASDFPLEAGDVVRVDERFI